MEKEEEEPIVDEPIYDHIIDPAGNEETNNEATHDESAPSEDSGMHDEPEQRNEPPADDETVQSSESATQDEPGLNSLVQGGSVIPEPPTQQESRKESAEDRLKTGSHTHDSTENTIKREARRKERREHESRSHRSTRDDPHTDKSKRDKSKTDGHRKDRPRENGARSDKHRRDEGNRDKSRRDGDKRDKDKRDGDRRDKDRRDKSKSDGDRRKSSRDVDKRKSSRDPDNKDKSRRDGDNREKDRRDRDKRDKSRRDGGDRDKDRRDHRSRRDGEKSDKDKRDGARNGKSGKSEHTKDEHRKSEYRKGEARKDEPVRNGHNDHLVLSKTAQDKSDVEDAAKGEPETNEPEEETVKDVHIEFDQKDAKFYASQWLRGKVKVNPERTKDIREIVLTFDGGNEHEKYLHERHLVHESDGSMEAKLEYPFELLLPEVLPSTFEGGQGYVRYEVKCYTSSFDWTRSEMKIPFTVIRNLDLSKYPQHPIHESNQKPAWSLCCWSGKEVVAGVYLNKSCYIPGEDIIINAKVTNESNRVIKRTMAQLIQETTYGFSYTRTKPSEVKVLATKKRGGVDPHSESKWEDTALRVPKVPASFLDGCKWIDIRYKVKFSVEPVGYKSTLEVDLDVVIGTQRRAHLDSQTSDTGSLDLLMD